MSRNEKEIDSRFNRLLPKLRQRSFKMASKIKRWRTLGRVLVFCFGCTATLIITAGLTKSLAKPWDATASLSMAVLITMSLVYLFGRWECVSLASIGLVPGKYSLSRILLGFLIGLVMAGL